MMFHYALHSPSFTYSRYSAAFLGWSSKIDPLKATAARDTSVNKAIDHRTRNTSRYLK